MIPNDPIIDQCYLALDIMAMENAMVMEAQPNDLKGSAASTNMATAKTDAGVANEKSANILIRALEAIGNAIMGVIGAIKEFFTRITMSDAEHAVLEQYEEAIRQDPSLAKTKIEVSDSKAIRAMFEDMLGQIENEYRAVQTDAGHPIDQVLQSIRKKLLEPIEAGTMIVAADQAIKMAQDCTPLAKELNKRLNEDSVATRALKKNLGDKGFRSLQKNIQKAAKDSMLFRLRVNVVKQFQTLLSDDFLKVAHGLKLGFKFLGNDKTKDEAKALIKGATKGVVKHKWKEHMDKKKKEGRMNIFDRARDAVEKLDPDYDPEDGKTHNQSVQSYLSGGKHKTADDEKNVEQAKREQTWLRKRNEKKAAKTRRVEGAMAAHRFAGGMHMASGDSPYTDVDNVLTLLESAIDDD